MSGYPQLCCSPTEKKEIVFQFLFLFFQNEAVNEWGLNIWKEYLNAKEKKRTEQNRNGSFYVKLMIIKNSSFFAMDIIYSKPKKKSLKRYKRKLIFESVSDYFSFPQTYLLIQEQLNYLFFLCCIKKYQRFKWNTKSR